MVFPAELKENAKPEYFKEWPDLYELAVKYGVEAAFDFVEKYHLRLKENESDPDKRFFVPKIKTVCFKMWDKLEKNVESKSVPK